LSLFVDHHVFIIQKDALDVEEEEEEEEEENPDEEDQDDDQGPIV